MRDPVTPEFTPESSLHQHEEVDKQSEVIKNTPSEAYEEDKFEESPAKGKEDLAYRYQDTVKLKNKQEVSPRLLKSKTLMNRLTSEKWNPYTIKVPKKTRTPKLDDGEPYVETIRRAETKKKVQFEIKKRPGSSRVSDRPVPE